MKAENRYLDSTYLDLNPDWHREDALWKAKLIVAILKDHQIQSNSICDVGCGTGDILRCLRTSFPQSTLFGYDIAVFADMPSVGSNALAIAFANFGFGYTVVDRMGTRLLRDPYTQKPFIKYYTTKRVGGAVDNYEAIKLQKISAS